jgi:hypothetical protein
MFERIAIAAVAAMLSTAVQAQSAPPPVPRYNCGIPRAQQQQAAAIAMQAYRNGDMATLSALNGLIEGYGQGCEMRYNRAM